MFLFFETWFDYNWQVRGSEINSHTFFINCTSLTFPFFPPIFEMEVLVLKPQSQPTEFVRFLMSIISRKMRFV